MAYSKTNNTNKSIKYLNKNFDDFKQSLLNHAQIYFPDTYNDFTEASPGTMLVEMASYVGDVLSFYTDAQIQEVFLQHAQEKENLFALAYGMGYVPSVTNASSTMLDIFVQIPALGAVNDYAPDWRYAPRIEKNSTFLPSSNTDIKFITQDTVNFKTSGSFNPTELSVYSIDGATNKPNKYLLKKSVKVISAEILTQTFEVGGIEKFKTFILEDTNILGIQSIVDTEGNNWTEVPYLAQETVFEEVPNTEAYDPDLKQYNAQTPFLLRTKKVPKRFITRFKSNESLEIQFGAGISSEADGDIIPNPDNVGLGLRDSRSLLDKAYDPSNFLYTKTYGEAPSNTTLTVTYLKGGGIQSNVESNSITRIGNLLTSRNQGGLVNSEFSTVINSITCTNPKAATGGGPGDTNEDIKLNAIANFSAQQRTVTKEDYMFRTLSMPTQFGKIAKSYIIQDNQISTETNKRIANPNALNIYVLGYNNRKHLTNVTSATKTNLGVYLDQYRMMTDSINIKNAYVINFNIEFEISVMRTYNNEEVLRRCIVELQDYFDIDKWQINQPIVIGEISALLYNTEGVQNVTDINFNNKSGETQGYSKYLYDMNSALKSNVIYPSQDPCIFELKYPNQDIIGRVKTL